ncbi:MAG TPA: SET domain-containing protein [Terracidiphilus sp.]|nr:SET domain-containing protein [Terracidiphilus sp.]
MKEEFLNDLAENVYCRVGVSKIQGVGVIAMRPIPANINPMKEMVECEYVEIPVAEIDALNLTPAVRKLVVDMCPENDGIFEVPSWGLNGINVSWYLNHSDNPNMREEDGYFFTLRDIEAGEELTVFYDTYSKRNL